MEFKNNPGRDDTRTGTQARVNSDRFFYILDQGWYALTREGLGGPFVEKEHAKNFVTNVITGKIQIE